MSVQKLTEHYFDEQPRFWVEASLYNNYEAGLFIIDNIRDFLNIKIIIYAKFLWINWTSDGLLKEFRENKSFKLESSGK